MIRIFAILVALTMSVGVARAQSPDAQARVLYKNGKMLYEEGRYEDAIAAFERAYELSPHRSLLLYNIANAKERVGDWRGALDALNRYRAFAPLQERATLERRIRNIEYRLRAVESIVEQMERPQERPVYQPDRVRAQTPIQPGPEKVQIEPATRWKMGTASVVMYSLAGAASVAGAVFAFQAEQARHEAAALCSTGDAVFCPAAAKPALDRDRIFSWLTDGSFSVAGASAVTGTIIMVVAKKKHRRQHLRVHPSFGGVGLTGRF